MNSLGEPTCLEELVCIRCCPVLFEILEEGDFRPYWQDERWQSNEPGPTIDIACTGQIGKEDFHVYRLRQYTDWDGPRWFAWGEYVPNGITVEDADYYFLDGGGSFKSREAAEKAIRVWCKYIEDEASSEQKLDYVI